MIDHFKQALNDLLSQYRYALRIRAFLQAVSEAVQTQEASRFGLQEGAALDAARGIMLDRAGLRLRENRGTLSDREFRLILKAKLKALRSDGRIVEVLDVFGQLYPDGSVQYTTAFPAAATLSAFTGSPTSSAMGQRIKRIMNLMRPAGVDVTYVEGPTNMFQFDKADQGFDQAPMGKTL